ncbi:hypothetical protein, partial [Desulfobacter sp.]|uniref:hypothetical protein n=1 Tax=Desulfobacter sp. TaxID=2294 RepID=UPI003D14ED72
GPRIWAPHTRQAGMGTALNMRSPYIINRHPRPQIFLFPCGRGIIGKFSHTFLLHFPRLIGGII